MNKKFYYICLSFFILACGQTKKEVVSEEVTSAEETLIIVSNDQFSLGQMEVGTLQEAIFPKKIAANGYLDVPLKIGPPFVLSWGGILRTVHCS